MKTFIALIVMMALFISLIFLGMPIVIDKETGKIKSEVQDLKAKVQILETIIKNREGAWNLSGLKPKDNLNKVINVVNSLSSKIAGLEDHLTKNNSSMEASLDGYNLANAELFKKQSETIDKLKNESAIAAKKIYFNSVIINLTAHIINAKMELMSKNIGSVKSELQIISDELQKAKNIVEDKNKKVFDDLKATVDNIKSELDISLPASNNMLNLLWYDLSKASGTL
jgi:outer membrane murein-binding lipoprotein Lpp